jgi:undecaprenyl-diphosphatase
MSLFELNEKIFFFLNQKIANPVLDFFVIFMLIFSFSLLILFPIYFLFKGNKFLAIYSLFCGFFLYWFGHAILKPIFHIPRPIVLFEKVRIVGPWHASSYSFPSTTTMLVFGFALPFFFNQRKIGKFLLALAFLISLSLIYCGFHTSLDVLAGILFSFLFAFIFDKILKTKNEPIN